MLVQITKSKTIILLIVGVEDLRYEVIVHFILYTLHPGLLLFRVRYFLLADTHVD